jgi:hypothetical protein
MFMSYSQNAGQNHNTDMANGSLENLTKFPYFRRIQNYIGKGIESTLNLEKA